MTGSDVNFYGLLYIDRQRNLDANLKRPSIDPVDVFISCAALLAKSAQDARVSFSLLTNEPELVSNALRSLDIAAPIVRPVQFSRSIPRVKNYFSAHFKLDALRALASGEFGQLVGLIDVDSVFLGGQRSNIQMATISSIASLDISSQVFLLHGAKRVQRDLEIIAASKFSNPSWFGGEFLTGSAANIRLLSDEIERCWPRYVDNIRSVHHVGDEMVVSAALNRLIQEGVPVVDMAQKKVVARWWSQRTKWAQPAFEEITDCALLHLPADKLYLSQQAKRPYAAEAFLKDYKIHLENKIARKRVFDFFRYWHSPTISKRA